MLTPEEYAKAIQQEAWDDLGSVIEDCVLRTIADAIRAAEERGRASTQADVNECGVWCPKCGAHLRAPKCDNLSL